MRLGIADRRRADSISVLLAAWLIVVAVSLGAAPGRAEATGPRESDLRTRALAGVHLGTPDFPCPPELRSRTEFWIRIFTEFDRDEKVLHDARYPWVIYEVLDVTGLDARAAKARQEERLAYYEELLGGMAETTPGSFSAAQHRVATLLSGVPEEAVYTRAKERLRFQSGIRGSFRAGLERSGRYLPYIESILRNENVPLEVAFLPHVESSFHPRAESHAGAVGLWQFTKSTGKIYLTVEGDIDERRDPFASTRAAARYLRKSHDTLDSWPLSVVSYNYGLAGVLRARQGLDTDDIVRILHEYDGPRFGFASQNFYCEFLAAIEVGRNADRYFNDVTLALPAWPQEFALDHYVKFSSLCMAFGVPEDEMAVWNPALGRSYLRGERHVPKGFVLRLPPTLGDPGPLYAALPADERFDSPPRPRGHQVVSGDTLGKIAQRYRVSLAELRDMNGLGTSDRIYPGQFLVLP